MKLAKREGFFLSWSLDPSRGSGRHEIWISNQSPIAFRFSGGKAPQINPAWIKALLAFSYTPRGLVALSETEATNWAQRNPLLAV